MASVYCVAAGSVNVPLFQDMDFAAPDVAKVLKWALYAMNGAVLSGLRCDRLASR